MELGNKEKKKIYISCAPIYQWKNIKTYSLYLIVHRLVIVTDRSRSKSFCRKVFGNNSMMRIEEKEREVSVVYPSRIPHLRCRIVGEGNRKEKIRARLWVERKFRRQIGLCCLLPYTRLVRPPASSSHKQNHQFERFPLTRAFSLCLCMHPSSSFIRRNRRELHSRVYHCPDNNDLPTREEARERSRGKGQTLCPGVDQAKRKRGRQPPRIQKYFTLTALRGIGWPTTRDPSPFRHNGPLHYLFVLDNVLRPWHYLLSTSFHLRFFY